MIGHVITSVASAKLVLTLWLLCYHLILENDSVCVFISSLFNVGLDGSSLATAVSLAAFKATVIEYAKDIAPSWCHSLLVQLM